MEKRHNITHCYRFGLLLMLFLLLTCSRLSAQTTLSPAANAKVAEGLNDYSVMKGLLPAKKAKDTVYVLISNITLNDPNLKMLRSKLGKNKKSVPAELRNGIVILAIVGKTNASDVYDTMDEPMQKVFTVSSMEDNKLLLEYKQQ